MTWHLVFHAELLLILYFWHLYYPKIFRFENDIPFLYVLHQSAKISMLTIKAGTFSKCLMLKHTETTASSYLLKNIIVLYDSNTYKKYINPTVIKHCCFILT